MSCIARPTYAFNNCVFISRNCTYELLVYVFSLVLVYLSWFRPGDREDQYARSAFQIRHRIRRQIRCVPGCVPRAPYIVFFYFYLVIDGLG